MEVPVNKYCEFPIAILNKLTNIKYSTDFVEFDISKNLEKHLRNVLESVLIENPMDLIFNTPHELFKFTDAFVNANVVAIQDAVTYEHLTKDAFLYYHLSDVRVIPTTEFVKFMGVVKDSFDNVIEVNAGTGLLGSILNIKSYDVKFFELPDYITSSFNNFNFDLNIGQNTKGGYVKGLTFYDDFDNIKQLLKSDINFKIEHKPVHSYLEIPVNMFFIQFIVDLFNQNRLHIVDDTVIIYISEIAGYIEQLRNIGLTGDVYKKTKASLNGDVDITNIVHILNKSIRIYYSEDNTYSSLVMISFLTYCLNLKSVLPSFLDVKDIFKDGSHDNYYKFTTYLPSGGLTDSQLGFAFEQDELFYILTKEMLLEMSKNKKEYDNIVDQLIQPNTPLSLSDLISHFENSAANKDLLDTIGVEMNTDSAELDADDLNWLNLQHANQSRLINLIITKFQKYTSADVVNVNIKDTTLTPSQIRRLYILIKNKHKVIYYPKRVIKADYKLAIKTNCANNLNNLVIAYNPSRSFNISSFKLYKRLNFLIFGRIVNLKRNIINVGNAVGFKYVLCEINTITPYSTPIKHENGMLFVIGKKSNSTFIDNVIVKYHLKVVIKNY